MYWHRFDFFAAATLLLSASIAFGASAADSLDLEPVIDDCVIEPSRVAELSSDVDGVIDQLLVKRGELIGKGQVLARLRSSIERATVELASARAARDQAIKAGKPEAVVEKIVAGKMEKYYSQHCLLEQPYVKDPDKSVGELLHEAIGRIGENMQIKRFTRYVLGESG